MLSEDVSQKLDQNSRVIEDFVNFYDIITE